MSGEERLLRAVRKPREMKPDDGRRNRGPHSPELRAAIARGTRRANWLRHQRDLAFVSLPHVPVPTALWLERAPASSRKKWPQVECVPCWQMDSWHATRPKGQHIEGAVPE